MFGLGKKLSIFGKKQKIDETFLEELEETLITSDISYDVVSELTSYLEKKKFKEEVSLEEVKAILKEKMLEIFDKADLKDYSLFIEDIKNFRNKNSEMPFTILMIGVNGAGKTSTIGKMSKMFADNKLKVSIAACDTFRTAAVEQVQDFAKRTGAHFIAKETGANASGLAYESVIEAKKNNSDVLIIDTAGRLHSREELMAELGKLTRAIKKHETEDVKVPAETFLVLDGTTGQNGLLQAENFGKEADMSAVILTKMDSSAKGGIALSMVKKYGNNISFVCFGETLNDIKPFNAKEFVDDLVEE
ncbi:MAG: signal recognition particle-docking protein FtsY [Alphaproteobacteria bacterium]|jgi:fused signal recognition particle receptor|nr:signal recognition particle-docking protein FtsY [Alphaproteobacteria bacterium]